MPTGVMAWPTLTMWSSPSKTLTILPKGHVKGSAELLYIKIKSPVFR